MEAPQAPDHNFLEACLFFNANTFSRQVLKLAETEFAQLKLSPAHASVLLMVYETQGITPKDLSRLLQLTPSTITRFVDALVKKRLLSRRSKGKMTFISATPKGLSLKPEVAAAYKRLVARYTDILGPETAFSLSGALAKAGDTVTKALGTP